MNWDVIENLDNLRDGITETVDNFQEQISQFHESYISKIIPDFGKYGDVAQFAAEMLPGVSEYNAIKDGDWTAFAIAAGIDLTAICVGGLSFGTGYAAVKGGSTAAKAGVKVATKEIAEAGAKKLSKEVVETGVKKVSVEIVENTTEKIFKETVEETAEKSTKEIIEAGTKKSTSKISKETIESTMKETAESTVGKGKKVFDKEIIKETGEKIDKTRFTEYIDDIQNITQREIKPKQQELLNNALKENDYFKVSHEKLKVERKKFDYDKARLIKEWEVETGDKWPVYVKDILNDKGEIIRRVNQPYDVHHIIELSVGGPNEWWNLHPAKFPSEHQNGIHRSEGVAKAIFGK